MTRDRREAIARYRNRPPEQGAYSITCTGSGRVWVGASPNLHAARNGTWFLLRHGDHRDATLQADWQAFGEGAFQFAVLETLDPDLAPVLVRELLKEKRRDWAARLDAGVLL